ncbi:carboxylesterase/lipase family protein [Agrobacterium sp. ICMP 6402]|uniref:carboxylesterase/lipase family protein n=1 Tax=Agrobacterium sp. ICMP 6402 TaxID=2292443 RepID=UPI0012973F39|nr:carboxylesterase family protein [Agrobacterium sp. ICMP 6402]MQB12956.1 carboxylesterase/lipase family protein [Agrobacterium sp. ICMP 6402]
MTIVQVAAGALQGIRENGIHAFLGVPYAAPVMPERRFEAPQPVLPWQDVRDATRLGPVCPQIPTYGPVGTAATSKLAFGEDFLTVNIRTPDPAGRSPVLFWIHGGGYAVGSANEPVLQSGAFAASGIVEVTVNYRLGALGFLHVEGKPDNRGLLDLIAALEWVRDNIAAFGGDPDRVTLAGRSAGGFAVATLMAMPRAKGLFHRAMPQSGASTAIASLEDAAKLSHRFLAAADTDDASLAALPMDRLLEIQRDLCNQSYGQHDFARDGTAAMLGVPFVPVVDGVSLSEHPETAAQAGRTAAVPMMIGCTTGEYVTHATAQPKMDFTLCAKLLHERVLPLGLTGSGIVERYRAALPGHSARGIWRAVAGDLVFQLPAIRFARLHARFNPVYKYLYGPLEADELGAPHGAEVGSVWYRDGSNSRDLPERQRVTDAGFAKAIHQLWVSFIKDERPAAPNGEWPLYHAEKPMVLRALVAGFGATLDPFDGRAALWLQTGEPTGIAR